MQAGRLPKQIKQEIREEIINSPEVDSGIAASPNSWPLLKTLSVKLERIPEKIPDNNEAAVPTNKEHPLPANKEQAVPTNEEQAVRAIEDPAPLNLAGRASPLSHIDITLEFCYKRKSAAAIASGDNGGGPEERPAVRTRFRFHVDRSEVTQVSFEREPATSTGGNKPNISKRKKDDGEHVTPSSSPAALEARRGASPTNDGDAAVLGLSGMPAVVRLALKEEEEKEEDSEADKENRGGSTGKKSSVTKKAKKGSPEEEYSSEEEYSPKTCKLPPKKKRGRKSGSGHNKPCQLSPELSALVGVESMTRPEVVKKVWSIIKKKNLFDPENRQYTICDDALLKVIRRKRFRAFGMMKYLKNHFIR